jgi:chemotaxis protein methyltransferase CheR
MPLELGRKPPLVPAGVPSLLGAIIHERTGIHFEDDRLDVLMEKLQPLVEERQCGSFLDYYYLLKYEENGREDWQRVMDALAVPETYFWREESQIRATVEHVVPQWFSRTSFPLRIWSAASSSGEEPYSLVIALLEAGWGDHPIEVRASDASPHALKKAKVGFYRENSFRTLPGPLKEKYFTAEAGGWKLSAEVLQRVTFSSANLLAADEISDLARSQVIFCRNVFIYFSSHGIRQTLATFASRMPRGGHLFVGASESLLKLTTDFELRELGDAFVYVRI